MWNMHNVPMEQTWLTDTNLHSTDDRHTENNSAGKSDSFKQITSFGHCFSVTKRNYLYCIVLVITHKCSQKYQSASRTRTTYFIIENKGLSWTQTPAHVWEWQMGVAEGRLRYWGEWGARGHTEMTSWDGGRRGMCRPSDDGCLTMEHREAYRSAFVLPGGAARPSE